MTSHFFSTSAVLVEWVLPNMMDPFDFRSRASSRGAREMSTAKRGESPTKPPLSLVRYHNTSLLAPPMPVFEPGITRLRWKRARRARGSE